MQFRRHLWHDDPTLRQEEVDDDDDDPDDDVDDEDDAEDDDLDDDLDDDDDDDDDFDEEDDGFDADTTIKRSEWGVGAYVPAVSDEVHIHLTVSANLAK